MPENYVLLERTELNASAASVTFANIPQTGYTDLKIVVSARASSGSPDMYLRFNGLNTNLSDRVAFGVGASTAGSNSGSNIRVTLGSASSTANTFSNSEIYIPNYASAVAKSVSIDSVAEDNGTTNNIMWIGAGLWNSTTAITQVDMVPSSSTFAAGSTFSLYGIASVGTTPAIAPKANGGNIIDFDGTYWIHTFLTSGTFTPQTNLNCEYLVVAGGGAGGNKRGGGGGAGGYRCSVSGESSGGGGSAESPITLASGSPIAITVGAGGAAIAQGATQTPGGSGTDSIFSTITSTGGGGGGSQDSLGNPGNPSNGGSGGASSAIALATINGGNGTTNQGTSGGTGSQTATDYGAGGGGASVAGQNVASGAVKGGNGGNGIASLITGSSVTRAGGGGGGVSSSATIGTGGSGGGGNGSNSVAQGGAGTINTGSGGGGGYSSNTDSRGGAGSSGIVIIRYPAA
jgi:hypothetical protein